jgi:hypothetical protein
MKAYVTKHQTLQIFKVNANTESIYITKVIKNTKLEGLE